MSSIPTTQQAFVASAFGTLRDVLSVSTDFPVPNLDLKSTQVLVRVKYASTNIVDVKIISCMFAKIYPGLDQIPFPAAFGCEGAGVVVACGSDVTKFKIGDEVAGFTGAGNEPGKVDGTYAQYATFEEKRLALIPEVLSFALAGAAPIALMTHDGLARKHPFKSVLITGASGGVGSFAVVLAKHHFKADNVFAVASGKNLDYVRSLGADVVINYETEDITTVIKNSVGKVDLVLDVAGQGSAQPLLEISHQYISPANTRIPALRKPDEPVTEFYLASTEGPDLEKALAILAQHITEVNKIRLTEYPLRQLVEALEKVDKGSGILGKIVIAIP